METIILSGGDGYGVEPDEVRFKGRLLASVSSSADRGSSRFSGDNGRGHVLSLYLKADGHYVCATEAYTWWQGEHDETIIGHANNLDKIYAFFGGGWLALDLYEAAGLSVRDGRLAMTESAA